MLLRGLVGDLEHRKQSVQGQFTNKGSIGVGHGLAPWSRLMLAARKEGCRGLGRDGGLVIGPTGQVVGGPSPSSVFLFEDSFPLGSCSH